MRPSHEQNPPIGGELDLQQRIAKLDPCSIALIEAFDEIAGNRLLEGVRPLFQLSANPPQGELGVRQEAAEQGVLR